MIPTPPLSSAPKTSIFGSTTAPPGAGFVPAVTPTTRPRPLKPPYASGWPRLNLASWSLEPRSAAADGLCLNRLNRVGIHGYAAFAATPDLWTPVEVADAWETALTIPRHILIRGDNGLYLHTANIRNIEWLKFHGSDHGNLYGISEVTPLIDGSLLLLNPQVQRFWRNSTNWIWADAIRNTALIDTRCHFEPVRLGASLLALRSKFNNRFCKRLSDYWTDSLNAASDTTSDVTTHLRVSEATKSKHVFDVQYLLGLASTTDQNPIAVAFGSVVNNSSFQTDVTVTVTQTTDVSTSYTFSNSFSFSQSISTEFRAGIPFLAEGKVEVEIGFEQSFSNEWNTTSTRRLEFATSYLVKDVPPGAEASVRVICSTARMRIPFTYRSRDTAPNDTDRPSQLFIDGIFEGVDAYKTEAIISNGSRTTVLSTTPFSTLSSLAST
ncbi:hypothetical protein GOP47_0015912 [Adiantum capillus-veneris]|uniref:Agglutinin domain-containing protein n=1 Tax=Adiantum capillus-veneris TaxID=13818 RepID=A0A9D4ZEE9_ADICA|nr:hypothetical protein GOP47_0015912 [Adiantum capillus-veneris]